MRSIFSDLTVASLLVANIATASLWERPFQHRGFYGWSLWRWNSSISWRMSASILECDVSFNKDQGLVCRHSLCDLHTTTNILLEPELAKKCTIPFTPTNTTSPTNALYYTRRHHYSWIPNPLREGRCFQLQCQNAQGVEIWYSRVANTVKRHMWYRPKTGQLYHPRRITPRAPQLLYVRLLPEANKTTAHTSFMGVRVISSKSGISRSWDLTRVL
jgi:hypothetical protein